MKHRWEFTFKDYSDLIDYWEQMCKDKRIFADQTLEKLYEDVWEFYPQECVEAGFRHQEIYYGWYERLFKRYRGLCYRGI